METANQKVERLRNKSDFFLKNNIKTFVKTYSNDYYFCEILIVGENYLYIYNFRGKRKGEKDRILWLDIDEVEEYKGEGEDEI